MERLLLRFFCVSVFLAFLTNGATIETTLTLERAWINVDGVVRDVITVNGQFPGPTIVGTVGDRLIVHVRNRLTYEATTIHWHGVVHKAENSVSMDGTFAITQYGILPGGDFTYNFLLEMPLTTFYHPHVFEQRADGMIYNTIVKYILIKHVRWLWRVDSQRP